MMHEGHMETEEFGHKGHHLGAASTDSPEGPECTEEKADSRVPNVSLSTGAQDAKQRFM